ncbi:MAG: hypothetical protein QM774_14000 [Gordonia sp. (in: high G+C Gram-positive bacteria)]|uniref:hypothetical protein n=1 Tax=Gordonia sp. (in: high G+C Gram-positive bacteria) TaxID=84139 RepID=UPI0039E49299
MFHQASAAQVWATAILLGAVVAVILTLVLNDHVFGIVAGGVVALVSGYLLRRESLKHRDDDGRPGR